MNLSKQVKVIKIAAAAGAATSAVLSDAVDTSGFEGCVFVGSIATAAANNIASAQSSSDNSADTYADLVGTGVAVGDNADSFLIDVYRPRERYLKCNIARGTSTATGDVYAILYGPRKMPTTHGATIDAETHVSPAEGTA